MAVKVRVYRCTSVRNNRALITKAFHSTRFCINAHVSHHTANDKVCDLFMLKIFHEARFYKIVWNMLFDQLLLFDWLSHLKDTAKWRLIKQIWQSFLC